MFGSMLRTRSWIDRRMLASPGVDLRREDVSSVAHVSSLGFFSADGVPFFFYAPTNQRHTSYHIQHTHHTAPNDCCCCCYFSQPAVGQKNKTSLGKRKSERTGYATRRHATRERRPSRSRRWPRDRSGVRRGQSRADRVCVLRYRVLAQHGCRASRRRLQRREGRRREGGRCGLRGEASDGRGWPCMHACSEDVMVAHAPALSSRACACLRNPVASRAKKRKYAELTIWT